MRAIREVVEIKSQQLLFTLPADFNERRVEMILLPLSQSESVVKEQQKPKRVRGALHKYANQKLVEFEKNAWGDAVEENYATS